MTQEELERIKEGWTQEISNGNEHYDGVRDGVLALIEALEKQDKALRWALDKIHDPYLYLGATGEHQCKFCYAIWQHWKGEWHKEYCEFQKAKAAILPERKEAEEFKSGPGINKFFNETKDRGADNGHG